MPLVISKSDISAGDGTAILITYQGLTQTDTNPAPFELVELADRCVQVVGTFNAGTVVIEGSNNGTDWEVLTDPQGNLLTKTAKFIEQILELPRYMRPRVSAGTGVDVNALFVLRRNSGIRT